MSIRYYPGTSIPMPYEEPTETTSVVPQALSRSVDSIPKLDHYTHPDSQRTVQPQQAPVPNFPKIAELVKKESILTVTSYNRDRSLYPSVSSYSVKFSDTDLQSSHVVGTTFKNVYSIELISAVYPNTNGCSDEPYLNVVIDEISTTTVHSNNQSTGSAFARLIPTDITVPAGKFLRSMSDGIDYNGKIYRAGNTLASLDRMTISIKDIDNNLFNFGADNVLPLPPNKAIQNFFTFKVTTLECDTNSINTNGIF